MGADNVTENIPEILQDLSAQIVCPTPKVWVFDEKSFIWMSVVCGYTLEKKFLAKPTT